MHGSEGGGGGCRGVLWQLGYCVARMVEGTVYDLLAKTCCWRWDTQHTWRFCFCTDCASASLHLISLCRADEKERCLHCLVVDLCRCGTDSPSTSPTTLLIIRLCVLPTYLRTDIIVKNQNGYLPGKGWSRPEAICKTTSLPSLPAANWPTHSKQPLCVGLRTVRTCKTLHVHVVPTTYVVYAPSPTDRAKDAITRTHCLFVPFRHKSACYRLWLNCRLDTPNPNHESSHI